MKQGKSLDNLMMNILTISTTIVLSVIVVACGRKQPVNGDSQLIITGLRDSLQCIADSYPGEIGIAVLTDCGDTLLVNNEDKYPLMSVFKLHQAIALCNTFSAQGQTIDSVVSIARNELNPDTWSPMLKNHTDSVITITIRDMLRYTLTQSDNNASNYMFDHMQPVADVDSFIATIIPRIEFRLRYTEADMWSDHTRSYDNHTSPLGAAILINRLFTDSILDTDDSRFIRTTLQECQTGTDRIVTPLADIDGISIAHKTGSGFHNPDGTLSAHNDVAHIILPDHRYYTLAVFVKDFHGNERDAAAAIASISAAIYPTITTLYADSQPR